MRVRPNFFIVGAPKSGTTAMSEYLKNHPKVFFSEPKEPHYFSTDIRSRHRIDRLEDYEYLFSSVPERRNVIGEGSVHYLQSKVAAYNIISYSPKAKILAMLRNPVDLALSWHAEAQYSEFETERSFQKVWKERVVNKLPFNGKGDPQLMDYAAVASLGTQLARLRSVVPVPQLKVVIFDDFVAETRATYLSILDFLELHDDLRQSFPKVNDSKRVRSHGLMQLSHAIAGLKRRAGITGKLGLLESINIKRQPNAALPPSFRAELVEWFEPEIAQLEALLHIDLRHWRY